MDLRVRHDNITNNFTVPDESVQRYDWHILTFDFLTLARGPQPGNDDSVGGRDPQRTAARPEAFPWNSLPYWWHSATMACSPWTCSGFTLSGTTPLSRTINATITLNHAPDRSPGGGPHARTDQYCPAPHRQFGLRRLLPGAAESKPHQLGRQGLGDKEGLCNAAPSQRAETRRQRLDRPVGPPTRSTAATTAAETSSRIASMPVGSGRLRSVVSLKRG